MRSILTAMWLLVMPAAALELGRAYGEHMVLPMGKEVSVRGKADARAEVILRFAGQEVKGRADGRGEWALGLAPMAACAEGKQLVVESGKERLSLGNVVVGRVYLCSGQSNMDFPLSSAVGGGSAISTAGKFPLVRVFNLTGVRTDARRYEPELLAKLDAGRNFEGRWRSAAPGAVENFSAIAWWTGLTLHERSGVPIGLVENAVGGSGTEAWLPREVIESRTMYREEFGKDWLASEKISDWARGRARDNLGERMEGNHPYKPGYLFETGVRGFAGFPFEGVLWYQGETNAEINDVEWNRSLIVDLVEGWRQGLGDPGLRFYLVQLPRIGGNDPLRRYWPEYRRAQAEAARMLKGVVLVETQDLGWESPDVHPPDKLPVAKRLAEAVMKGLR
ncbi:sialate O-acetylesterase [Luteolibacter sp. GHJ8]|uniref:Sialate O-acetylesterase n=1 Tax=Luteolibacter rhizosphaerae TaxID=2989719 RepID=A0ABT3FWT9_9BACT|nr:sialate O-acetylesterase [Luteolibacter rhizosphaerae]MCW1912043.1 sialate O-acetylesterase [Luteolibacter rhizosphaerae]